MDVIKYQLIIIITVSLTYLFGGRKMAFCVSLFWTVWTLVLLSYSPLVVTQLGFTWGTYFVCWRIMLTRREIKELRDVISTYPVPVQKDIENAAKASRIDKIIGVQHRKELNAAVDTATNRLVILSGWISSSVVNDRFSDRIDRALGRGVLLFIGYGWEDSKGSHVESDSASDALMRLERLRVSHPRSLVVTKFVNDQKILIKDDDYMICSSSNWLSNNVFRNSEMSIKIHSSSLEGSEAERITEEVEQGSRDNA